MEIGLSLKSWPYGATILRSANYLFRVSQKRGNLAGGVKFVWLEFHGLFTRSLSAKEANPAKFENSETQVFQQISEIRDLWVGFRVRVPLRSQSFGKLREPEKPGPVLRPALWKLAQIRNQTAMRTA